ncbi:hypothetical protein ABTQ08_20275, partial [Acinetobacter baumannii]
FGHRVLALLALVIVMGNLLYPDMVYAKGAEHAGDHGGARGARGARGRSGRGYGNGYGWGGTYNDTYWVNRKKVPGTIGPGPTSRAKKDLLK